MDALDLIAKLKMDISDYENGLDKAENMANKKGSGIKSAFGKVASGVGTVMATATKVTAAAITTAASGVAAITTAAVANYSQYEQLYGGTKLMFGDAADYIMDKSKEAYKSVQLSQNEYLTQVNGFATGLKTSLGGNEQAAAELADKIITAEADIVAATGNTQENVQNAFNGIMKGNYQMLDNLNLGITPTKAGMQEVIDKVNEWHDAQGEASNYTIDSLADCEAAVVDYVEMMGYSGYAANEASQTIQGSLSSVKAAWSNLLTGMADDEADVDTLINNLIDSLVGYTDEAGNEVNGLLDNIVPVVETALTGIGTLIEKVVPSALKILPTLITDVLPDIITAGTELMQGLVDAMNDSSNMESVKNVISQLVNSLVTMLPDIITLGGEIVGTLGSAIMDNLDTILGAAGQLLETILTGLSENSEKLSTGAVTLISMLAGFIGENIDLILNSALLIVEGLANGLIENLDTLMNAGLDLLMAIVDAIPDFLVELANALPDIITAIIDFLTGDGLTDILEGATTMFMGLVEALPDILNALVDGVGQLIDSVLSFMSGDGSSEILESAFYMFLNIAAALPEILGTLLGALGELLVHVVTSLHSYASNMKNAAKELFGKIKDAVTEIGSEVVSKIKEKVKEWVEAIKSKVSEFKTIGGNLITGLWNGISDKAQWVYDKLTGMGETIVNKVKGIFGVASPSKVFAEIGGYLAEGLGIGWEDEIDKVNKDIEGDLKYQGEIDMTGTSLNSGMVASNTNNAFNIVLNTTTQLDSDIISEKTYKYTVNRVGNETRALSMAEGGGY